MQQTDCRSFLSHAHSLLMCPRTVGDKRPVDRRNHTHGERFARLQSHCSSSVTRSRSTRALMASGDVGSFGRTRKTGATRFVSLAYKDIVAPIKFRFPMFDSPSGLGVRQASQALAAGWLMSVQSWQAQSSSSFLATLSPALWLYAHSIRLFLTGSLLDKEKQGRKK